MARKRLTRPQRAALTRSELLETAERRFYRDGYHATTLESIAEEAGYSKGAVYSALSNATNNGSCSRSSSGSTPHANPTYSTNSPSATAASAQD